MQEKISYRDAFCLFILMIVSTVVVTGLPAKLEQDSWISVLLSLVLVIPLMLIYARITHLMPGKDIFEMAEAVFGKVASKIISILFSVYFIFVCAVITNSFTQFVRLTSLFKTSLIIIMVFLVIGALYIAKSGITTLGKTSFVMLIIVFIAMTVSVMTVIPVMDFSNMQPVFNHSIEEFSTGAAQTAVYPYGELVILLALLGPLKKGSSPYRIYVAGAVVATLLILVVFIRNILVLGPNSAQALYYPTYKATSVAKVGGFLERIEAVLGIVYLLISMVKIAACQIAASKGMAKGFAVKSYQTLVVPISLFCLAFAVILYSNSMQLFSYLSTYFVYAIPFQMIIPVAIWITAEVKFRKSKQIKVPVVESVADGI